VNPMRGSCQEKASLTWAAVAGGLLSQAESLGAKVVGIEIDKKRAAALNERGHNVYCGSVDDYVGIASARFDKVVLSQSA